MNSLLIFENREFGRLNVVYHDGKIFVDGIQVCSILGYSNPRGAVLRHCEVEGIVFQDIEIVTGKRSDGTDAIKYISRKYIDEANLYRLIFKSKLPNSKKFERWIFEEILPSIRKNGMYMTDNKIEEALNNPDLIIQMATKLKKEREEKIAYMKRSDSLEDRLWQDKPYTNFARQIEVSDGALAIGQFAKLLYNNNIKIGRNRLFSWFRENGYFIKSGKEKNMPKQIYIEQGLFRICERIVTTAEGEKISATTLITGKGQVYFAKRIFEEINDDFIEMY